MTKLDAYESALFLAKMAIHEIDHKPDLRSQLAVIRLRAAVQALEGNVDMQTFEAKILGNPT
jgi:hypothetical protein